jgi:hypothetical protein
LPAMVNVSFASSTRRQSPDPNSRRNPPTRTSARNRNCPESDGHPIAKGKIVEDKVWV